MKAGEAIHGRYNPHHSVGVSSSAYGAPGNRGFDCYGESVVKDEFDPTLCPKCNSSEVDELGASNGNGRRQCRVCGHWFCVILAGGKPVARVPFFEEDEYRGVSEMTIEINTLSVNQLCDRKAEIARELGEIDRMLSALNAMGARMKRGRKA